MTPLRYVPEAVLLRHRGVGHPFHHWLLSLDERACYPLNSIWIPVLIIFLAVFASAATRTSACLFVVKLLVFLRSFIHAIVLFFLPHFQLLLKQHVKGLFEITPTAVVVICSGRGGKRNGITFKAVDAATAMMTGARSVLGLK